MNDDLERLWKEASVTSRNCPGYTEENLENLSE
jgi:hypothetical protein